MNQRLTFLSIAATDMLAAAGWYNRQRKGLGEDFKLCVEEALETIVRNPSAFSPVGHGFRRMLTRRFPYAIYFRHDGNSVKIYGVLHTRRAPDVLTERTD